jgi:hypothetical protein
MPVPGVGHDDGGIAQVDRAQLALDGTDHRFQVPEVRRLGRDLGGQDDLLVVDGRLGVVALQRRLAMGAHDPRIVIGRVDQPARRQRRLVGLIMPGAIRRDPSAAIPRARRASWAR